MQICINPDHRDGGHEVTSFVANALKLWTSHVRLFQGTQETCERGPGKNKCLTALIKRAWNYVSVYLISL